jgi:hypothetical protein
LFLHLNHINTDSGFGILLVKMNFYEVSYAQPIPAIEGEKRTANVK